MSAEADGGFKGFRACGPAGGGHRGGPDGGRLQERPLQERAGAGAAAERCRVLPWGRARHGGGGGACLPPGPRPHPLPVPPPLRDR